MVFFEAFINISKILHQIFLGSSTLHIPAMHRPVAFFIIISGVIRVARILFFIFVFKFFSKFSHKSVEFFITFFIIVALNFFEIFM